MGKVKVRNGLMYEICRNSTTVTYRSHASVNYTFWMPVEVWDALPDYQP